jgi:transposase-like protein
MPSELPDNVQRWTAKRRAAVVTMILKGETSSQEVARKYGLRVADVEEWRDRFLVGAENALRSRRRDEMAARDAEIKRLREKIGELVLDIDILKEGMRDHPLGSRLLGGLRSDSQHRNDESVE